MTQEFSGDVLLKISDVCAMLSLSKSTVYMLVSARSFPTPP